MIKTLISDLSYGRISLSDALTRAKIIASKISDQKFKSWLSNELLGYQKENDNIPDYRIVPCKIVGILQHVNGYRQTIEVPTIKFDKELRKSFERKIIPRSISDIEDISKKNASSQFIQMPFDINALALLNNLLEIDMEEEAIVEGCFQIFAQDFKRIIDITKQKLLDILLQLDETFPNLENDFTTNKENIRKISQIVNHNINISVDNKNNQTMSNDKYENKGQTVVMGPNANVQISSLHQVNQTLPENFDYFKLVEELSTLKEKVISEATIENDGNKFKIVSDIIASENAAKNKDSRSIFEHLAKGGKWLLDTAKEIGVDIAADVIKKSINL